MYQKGSSSLDDQIKINNNLEALARLIYAHNIYFINLF